MRVVSSADWRDAVPFDTPVIAAEVAPGEPIRCFVCAASSDPLPRTELWAVKHHHPNHHGGYVRFYCLEHRPTPAPVAPVETRGPRTAAKRQPRVVAPRRPVVVERQRESCPNCFVEVSASGECGMCGWSA